MAFFFFQSVTFVCFPCVTVSTKYVCKDIQVTTPSECQLFLKQCARRGHTHLGKRTRLSPFLGTWRSVRSTVGGQGMLLNKHVRQQGLRSYSGAASSSAWSQAGHAVSSETSRHFACWLLGWSQAGGARPEGGPPLAFGLVVLLLLLPPQSKK